jgi:hypothetical protein
MVAGSSAVVLAGGVVEWESTRNELVLLVCYESE